MAMEETGLFINFITKQKVNRKHITERQQKVHNRELTEIHNRKSTENTKQKVNRKYITESEQKTHNRKSTENTKQKVKRHDNAW